MDVYWFEQIAADVPAGEDWLGAKEVSHLHTLRFPKRRADWLIGRWTAKNAVAIFFSLGRAHQALSSIEIRPSPSGAPQVFLKNVLADVTVSLSHRAGIGLCALAPSGVSLGCDLETIEPHGDAFPVDYFTPEEQVLVTHAPTIADSLRALTLLWSAKESALKALGEGLRLDTRSVVVRFPGISEKFSQSTDWRPLQVHYRPDVIFHGWWNQSGEFLRTIVALPAPTPPIPLYFGYQVPALL